MWPYFFLAALVGALGLVLVVVWWPGGYPDEDDLVKFAGAIDSVVVRDDISDTGAGAMLPAITSAYFTLEGVAGEFRYPSSHPKYPIVRDYTAVAIDVWVDAAEIGSGGPMTIWQIREHNPYNLLVEETFVGYDEIVGRLTEIDRSMVAAGGWLVAGAAALILLGLAARLWNRKAPPPT